MLGLLITPPKAVKATLVRILGLLRSAPKGNKSESGLAWSADRARGPVWGLVNDLFGVLDPDASWKALAGFALPPLSA